MDQRLALGHLTACIATHFEEDIVDIRIGITQAVREISLEQNDDERDATKAKIESALAGTTDVLWLTDKRGRTVGVAAAKISYVEIGSVEGDRRIGFGG